MSREKTTNKTIISNLTPSWGWTLGLGIFLVLLGAIGLGMAVGLTLVSMIFFSALLIIAGITHAIEVFKYKEWKGMIWRAFVAVLYIVGGCVVFYDPFMASSLITALLAGVFIIIGISRIALAFALKDSKGWGWLLFAGIMAIVLGLLIMMQWPLSGLWVIGMFVAVEMLVTGWTYIFVAFAQRRAS